MPPAASPIISRRRYRSAAREQRARETQERILAAASAEFERVGYAATTIRAVAGAAGVSVPTVELAFRTKPQLLRAAISFAIRGDADSRPMLQREWAKRAETAASLSGFLAIVGQVLVDAEQRSAGLVVAAVEAANLDDSMRALAEELRAQRAETAAWILDGALKRSSPRADIDREQAIDTVWLLMDPHVFCTLTRDRGWTADKFERWFSDSVFRLVLGFGESRDADGSRQRPRSRSAPTGTRKERTA